MTQENMQVDISKAITMLTELQQENQLNFACSLALNNTMKLIRDAVKDEMKTKLALRRVAWNLSMVRFDRKDWATKQKLNATLRIAGEATNLLRLQTGQDHLPINGHKYLPIPNFTVFGTKIITKDNPLNIKNLKLHKTPHGLQGEQGTFLAQTSGKTPVIVQRVAKANAKGRVKKGADRASGTRILYRLVKKTKTPKKFDLFAIATKIVKQYFQDELRKAVEKAIETARGKAK